MLIHRRALEVVRLCEKPEEGTAPVTSHVFIADDGRITATNGHAVLRVRGLVKEEPNLFMTDAPGVDELSAHVLPRDMVRDFLSAWDGDQVIVRDDEAGTLIETVDGQTSRRFEAKTTVLDPPGFDSVIKKPKDGRSVILNIDLLKRVTAALKALGATSVRLTFGEDEHVPIHLSARVEIEEDAIDGALMPMREQ